jgi:hypothetical protein
MLYQVCGYTYSGYVEMMLENPANPKIGGNKYNRHLAERFTMDTFTSLKIQVTKGMYVIKAGSQTMRVLRKQMKISAH